MLTELRDIIARTQSTLIQDMLGTIALLVILFAGLSLPAAL